MLALDLKLKDIPEEGLDLRVPFPPDVLKDALDDVEVGRSHVAADLRVLRTGENVDIHGRLQGDVQVPCVRCLNEAHVPIDVPLHIVVGPDELGGEDSLDAEVEYFTHDGEVVHLGDALRESLILSVPMTALCREDCKGLCPVCGRDKNKGDADCGHAEHPPDPRLAALKDIKL